MRMVEKKLKSDHKIVLVIGNGFDLDLGLKTQYKNFMESVYFKSYTNDNVLKRTPKTGISNNLFKYLQNQLGLQNWIDIETELLKIATEKRRVNMDGVTKLVNIQATSYLEYDFECIHSALCSYLESLDYNCIDHDSVALKVLDLIAQHQNSEIISYNYTDIHKLEPFVGNINCSVDHVHGRISDKSIILGFQDDADIDQSFCFMIKSFSPHFKSHNVRNKLLKADEIIFFGHSLGCTDYHYFEDLFKYQSQADKANKDLIMRIFTYDEKARREILFQLREMNEKRTDMIYELCDFEIYRTASDMDKNKISKYLSELLDRINLLNPAQYEDVLGVISV